MDMGVSSAEQCAQCAVNITANAPPPVLVPVDLSPSAGQVLATAGELATGLGTSLVVLHVVHDSVDNPGRYHDPSNGHHPTPLADVARKKLDSLISTQAEQKPELECLQDARVLLVEGLPPQRILEVAETECPKMIVMGSHGRHGFSRVLMGSVAEAVTRSSRVAVTIVKTPTA